MPKGRPTKYKPEYCEQLIDYFEEKVKKREFPFLSQFAREVMGICRDSAFDYAKKYPGFFDAYKKAKDIQKEFLIKQTLNGFYNPTFAIFTAKNLTDMRDVKSLEHTGEGGKPIQIDMRKFSDKELKSLDKLVEKIHIDEEET